MNPTAHHTTTPSTSVRRGRSFGIAVGIVGLLAVLSACGSDDDASADTSAVPDTGTSSGTVTVEDAWIREPAAGQTAAAAYGTVVNLTDHEVTLVDASSPGFDDVSVHETTMAADGTMSMGEPEGGFPIAAGASFVLEPGGAHVMFQGVDPAAFGSPVEVTFLFDDGTDAGLEVTVDAEVRSIDDGVNDGPDDDMDDMDMTTEMPMGTEMPMDTAGS